MCGLYGWIAKNGSVTRKEKTVLTHALAWKTQVRGDNSYSLLVRNALTKQLSILRNVNTWKAEKKRKKWEQTYIETANMVMGHNRFATHGAINMRNAHCFELGNFIMSHNGVIFNIAKYIRESTIIPVGETDSEAVLAWVISQKKGIEGFLDIETYSDSFSVYDKSNHSLYLITKGKSLFVVETANLIMYASEQTILSTSLSIAFPSMKFEVEEIISDKIVEVTDKNEIKLVKFEPELIATSKSRSFTQWELDNANGYGAIPVDTYIAKNGNKQPWWKDEDERYSG